MLTHTENLRKALCKIRKALCRNGKALCRKNKSAPSKNKSAPRVIVAPNTIIKALMHIFSDKALLQMILQNILEILYTS